MEQFSGCIVLRKTSKIQKYINVLFCVRKEEIYVYTYSSFCKKKYRSKKLEANRNGGDVAKGMETAEKYL